MQDLRARSSVLAVIVTCAMRELAVAVRVTLMRAVVVLVTLVCVVLVLMTLMLAVAMLVIAVLIHAVTMLVIAVRVIVLVSQIRLLVPERRNKHLAKSMAQQVAADKHTPGLILRFVTRNGPRAFYQVKLDPLITARQRALCACKLSKNAS